MRELKPQGGLVIWPVQSKHSLIISVSKLVIFSANHETWPLLFQSEWSQRDKMSALWPKTVAKVPSAHKMLLSIGYSFICFMLCLLLLFKTRSYFIFQTGPTFVPILLPETPNCWDCRCESQSPARVRAFILNFYSCTHGWVYDTCVQVPMKAERKYQFPWSECSRCQATPSLGDGNWGQPL